MIIPDYIKREIGDIITRLHERGIITIVVAMDASGQATCDASEGLDSEVPRLLRVFADSIEGGIQ